MLLARHPNVIRQYEHSLEAADDYFLGDHGLQASNGERGLTTRDIPDAHGDKVNKDGQRVWEADTTYLMRKMTSYGPPKPSDYPDIPRDKLDRLPENMAFTLQYPGLARLGSALVSTNGDKRKAYALLHAQDAQRGFKTRTEMARFLIYEDARRWGARRELQNLADRRRPPQPPRRPRLWERMGHTLLVNTFKPYNKTVG